MHKKFMWNSKFPRHNGAEVCRSDLPRCCYVTCLGNTRDRLARRCSKSDAGAKIPGIKSPLIPTKTITLLLRGRRPKPWLSHFAVQVVGSYLIFIAVARVDAAKGTRRARTMHSLGFWGKGNYLFKKQLHLWNEIWIAWICARTRMLFVKFMPARNINYVSR